MNIQEFTEKYKDSKKISIREFVRRCINRKELDDLFGTEIAAGITLIDLLDGELNDTRVSPQVMSVLKALMGEKMDSQSEVIPYFREMINRGDSSVDGLINKLKGTLGELKFKEAFGSGVRLAESGSQKGFDLITDKGEYIQVKMYSNANSVIEAIEENAKRIKNNEMLYDGQVVRKINYAVSSNIYEELKEEGVESTYGIKLYEVPMSAQQAGEIVGDEINETAWNNFFKDTFGMALTSLALHSTINTFLFVFGKKDRKEAIVDTIKSTVLTTITINIGRLAEAISLGIIPMPPIAWVVGFSSTVGSRATLKRIEKRWDWTAFMSQDNKRLKNLIFQLS
jgi:hypothetical protein